MGVDFSVEELDALLDAVRYKHSVAKECDPKYDAEVWKPLLDKLVRLANAASN